MIDSVNDIYIGYKKLIFKNNKIIANNPFIYNTYGENKHTDIVPKYFNKQFNGTFFETWFLHIDIKKINVLSIIYGPWKQK